MMTDEMGVELAKAFEEALNQIAVIAGALFVTMLLGIILGIALIIQGKKKNSKYYYLIATFTLAYSSIILIIFIYSIVNIYIL